MKRYVVTVKEIHWQDVFVEAENELEALAKVKEGEGDYYDASDYIETLPIEDWTVSEKTD